MTRLEQVVSSLPEIYQPIYQHEEFRFMSSRACDDRLVHIRKVYDALQNQLNRQVRVLDLGCAQGYISLTIASWGADVVGVDFFDKNIEVCNLLASEHEDYQILFVLNRVEDYLKYLKANEFDLVLGLSVFHHMCNMYGWESVRDLLSETAAKIKVGIFELALNSEPVHWSKALPDDYKMVLQGFLCVKLLAYNGTHLSSKQRPLVFASNCYLYFQLTGLLEIDDVRLQSHDGAIALAKKRYFFAENKFVKCVDIRPAGGTISAAVQQEFRQELEFLEEMGGVEGFPNVYALENNGDEIWIVREKIDGILLSEKIQHNEYFDAWDVIKQTLHWLVILERHGYYCNDVRTWNILYDQHGNVWLIDYGSIGKRRSDCVWPWDLLLSFFIFMNEVFDRKYNKAFVRSTKMLTAIKRHISHQQYLDILKIRDTENCFQAMYDILFSTKGDIKDCSCDLRDKEVLALEALVEFVVNDWMQEKSRLYDAIKEIEQYKIYSSELLDKLTEVLIEHQKKLEELEEKLT